MNNYLKAYLAGAFILLIALLLLSTCRHNRGEAPVRPEDVGGDGDIKITLLWDFPGDLDLHVMEPNGEEIWYRNLRDDSRGGGHLDVDEISGGSGSAENAYWRNPRNGQYKVNVVFYRVDDEAPNGGPAKVVVKVDGVSRQYNLQMRTLGQDSHVVTFNYPPAAESQTPAAPDSSRQQ